MPVYKDTDRGTWYVDFRYKDHSEKWRRKKKRGFKTQREAKAWEREFLSTIHADATITFKILSQLYLDDQAVRNKPTTILNARKKITNHILPFFGEMKIDDVSVAQVRQWQNQTLQKGLSPVYVRSIHDQLSSLFNFAMKFYGLKENPARICGAVGSSKPIQPMQIWTVNQFNRFISYKNIACNPVTFALFSLLFWTGIRNGEALALTLNDFDFEKRLLHITKTYSVVDGVEMITSPKTKKSKRTIQINGFLCDIMQKYISRLYDLKLTDRIFPYNPTYANTFIKRYANPAGVPNIRTHDLRHSHASLLINSGVDILIVSERLGHESVKITLDTYAHLYQNREHEAVDALDHAFSTAPILPPQIHLFSSESA